MDGIITNPRDFSRMDRDVRAIEPQRCKYCGQEALPSGAFWVETDLCSVCAKGLCLVCSEKTPDDSRSKTCHRCRVERVGRILRSTKAKAIEYQARKLGHLRTRPAAPEEEEGRLDTSKATSV